MAVFTVLALLLTLPAPVPAAATASASALSVPGVVVKLGNASLEEYQHGDPASRVLLTQSH